MINLLEFLDASSICFLPDAPYPDLLRDLMAHCLRDAESERQRKAADDILAKSRSATPQDINLGHGFALVHTRQTGLDRIHIALGLLPGSRKLLRGDHVHTLLGLVIPQRQSRMYLSLLARVSRMLERPDAGAVFAQAGARGAQGQPEAREAAVTAVMSFVQQFEAT